MKLFRWLRSWFRKPQPTPPRLTVVRGVPQSGRPVRGNACRSFPSRPSRGNAA
jgi:hypothetical protein